MVSVELKERYLLEFTPGEGCELVIVEEQAYLKYDRRFFPDEAENWEDYERALVEQIRALGGIKEGHFAKYDDMSFPEGGLIHGETLYIRLPPDCEFGDQVKDELRGRSFVEFLRDVGIPPGRWPLYVA